MESPIKVLKNATQIAAIYYDKSPSNPRDDDNLGIIIGWHDRYTIGDKNPYRDPEDFREEYNEKNALIFPLYLYDHSGVSLKMEPFSCPWDSGQVGYVFATKESVRKEYSCKKITKSVIERATNLLQSEVKVYSRYMNGEIYRYEITDRLTGKVIDSCGNFDDDDYILTELPDDMEECEFYMESHVVVIDEDEIIDVEFAIESE